ncbi:MAG: response regulator [Rhizobiales bacterium]|nr:response regulator [Hyphomicrobiales bacterium]
MTMSPFENVLIVDDDPILRTVAFAYFGALGTPQILQASNGREALELIQQYRPAIDCILCDLNMPELDGVQFMRQLKDCAFSGDIAIISGEGREVLGTARDLAQSLGLNSVGALCKPLKAGDLDQVVGMTQPATSVVTP